MATRVSLGVTLTRISRFIGGVASAHAGCRAWIRPSVDARETDPGARAVRDLPSEGSGGRIETLTSPLPPPPRDESRMRGAGPGGPWVRRRSETERVGSGGT